MVKIHWLAGIVCLAVMVASADQVVMQNGDVYNGKLLSMNTNAVVLQSEVLGKITLSPAKVATINLNAAAGAPTTPPPAAVAPGGSPLPRLPAVAQTGQSINVSGGLSQLGSQTNLIQQIQSQFLAGAGPEANEKFNDLLNGVMSGKVSMDDLRQQAQAAADQLRSMQKDLGPDASEAVDGYLSVLNDFLSESASSTGNTNTGSSATLSTSPPPVPAVGTQ